MTSYVLTQLWNNAMSAMPSDWTLRVVVVRPREAAALHAHTVQKRLAA